MGPLKRFELWGRQILVRLVGLVLGVRQRGVTLPDAPKILVVRLDERVGNLLMLTPLLSTLKARYPGAHVDVLGSAKGRMLIATHADIDAFLPFRKKAIFAADGPLRTAFRLRRRRYDAAIEASNPTDPSATQAILVRFCGARHTIGADHPGFGRLFSARAQIPPEDSGEHEIDLRLELLSPMPGEARVRSMSLPARDALTGGSSTTALLERLANVRYAVLNIGARIADKRLDAQQYASLVDAVTNASLTAILAWGPAEKALAEAVHAARPAAILAPPTSLVELEALVKNATATISCDTGPMHLAVAAGTPTCGLFVSTDPARYGYPEPPHHVVDARGGFGPSEVEGVARWLAAVD